MTEASPYPLPQESAHDIAGNGNTASNNHSLTIDSTAPTVSITTNTPQSVNTESFTLTGGADEAGSTVEVFQNGGTIGTTTATNGSWTITGHADGGSQHINGNRNR